MRYWYALADYEPKQDGANLLVFEKQSDRDNAIKHSDGRLYPTTSRIAYRLMCDYCDVAMWSLDTNSLVEHFARMGGSVTYDMD